MATQIIARGARRSAAPTYERVDPTRSQAVVADPDLLRKLIFDTTTQGVVGDAYAGNSVAEAFGRGSFTATGQGNNQSGNTSQGGFNTGTSPNSAATAAALGKGISALGAITGNPDAAAIGGITGFAGNVAGMSPGDALGAFGTLGANVAGVPGAAIGLGRAAMTGNIGLGIDSALSLANPAIGAINAIAGMLGIGTIGSFAAGKFGWSDAGDQGNGVTSTGVGDRTLGSIVGTPLGPPTGPVGGSVGGGYTSTGPGATSGFGSNGMGSGFGGGRGGGGSPSGNNGGPGPGNNGGNASGAGSSQA